MFSFIHKWLWVWCLSLNICNSDVLVAIGTLQFFYFQFFKFPRIVNILYYNTQKLRCFNLSAWKDWKVPRQIFVINCFQHCIPEKDVQYLFLHVFKLLHLLNLNIHFACLKLTKKEKIIVYQRINFHLSSACLLFVSQLALTKHASDVQLKVTDLSVRPLWQNGKIKNVLTATGFHQIGLLLNFNKTPSQKWVLKLGCCFHDLQL